MLLSLWQKLLPQNRTNISYLQSALDVQLLVRFRKQPQPFNTQLHNHLYAATQLDAFPRAKIPLRFIAAISNRNNFAMATRVLCPVATASPPNYLSRLLECVPRCVKIPAKHKPHTSILRALSELANKGPRSHATHCKDAATNVEASASISRQSGDSPFGWVIQ